MNTKPSLSHFSSILISFVFLWGVFSFLYDDMKMPIPVILAVLVVALLVFLRESESLSVTWTYSGVKQNHLDTLTVAKFDRIPERLLEEIKSELPDMKYTIFPSSEASPALIIFQLDWDCFPKKWTENSVIGGPLFPWMVDRLKRWLRTTMEKKFAHTSIGETLHFYPVEKEDSDRGL
jgi:hypothetical protein